MSEKAIYILLTDTGTWFSRMIKLYTGAPYNHASIALDEELDHLYSFGRKVYTNPFSAGFIHEHVDKGVYLHQKHTSCALYKMNIEQEQYERLRQIIAQFEIFSSKYRYNLLGIFAMAINMELKRSNAYTCSQFVATVLNWSGVSLLDKSPELMRPDDFPKISNLELIYEGKLHDYFSVHHPTFQVSNAINI